MAMPLGEVSLADAPMLRRASKLALVEGKSSFRALLDGIVGIGIHRPKDEGYDYNYDNKSNDAFTTSFTGFSNFNITAI